MLTLTLLTRMQRVISGFRRDERGVSAIEFALIVPVMLTLYISAVQIAQGIAVDRKVTLAARTVADLVAQSQNPTIDAAGVSTVFKAATDVMSPYADSTENALKLMVRVTVIDIDAKSQPAIKWSRAKNGSPLSGTVTVPAALLVPNTTLVFGEANYAYSSPIGESVFGFLAGDKVLNLNDQIYMRPRMVSTIDCPSCSS